MGPGGRRTGDPMRVDVPTLMFVIFILLFIGLFVLAGGVFGFHLVTFAFLTFIGFVILMIAYTSRVIQEPAAK